MHDAAIANHHNSLLKMNLTWGFNLQHWKVTDYTLVG